MGCLMWIPCFISLYSPLNLYLIILWILDFKYILLLLLLLCICDFFESYISYIPMCYYMNYVLQIYSPQNLYFYTFDFGL